MIRKHSIQYILLALLAGNLAFTSCSDSMVEEKLFSQIGDGNLSDIEGARLLTNGIYGYVQYFSYFGGNNWLMNVSSYSDEFFCNAEVSGGRLVDSIDDGVVIYSDDAIMN